MYCTSTTVFFTQNLFLYNCICCRVILTRPEIDNAHKETSGRVFGEHFAIEATFDDADKCEEAKLLSTASFTISTCTPESGPHLGTGSATPAASTAMILHEFQSAAQVPYSSKLGVAQDTSLETLGVQYLCGHLVKNMLTDMTQQAAMSQTVSISVTDKMSKPLKEISKEENRI